FSGAGTDPGDVVNAGDGFNLVFGDNGQITAANANTPNFGLLPMTVGLAETVSSLIGGDDTINTGIGKDVIFGGIDGDTINASNGTNVVIGDSGLVDWTAKDTGRVYAAATVPAGGILPG